MSKRVEFRDYIVIVWDKRSRSPVELHLREFTKAEARSAARAAGWRDGILDVRDVTA